MSGTRSRGVSYGDRFIPNRAGLNLQAAYSLIDSPLNTNDNNLNTTNNNSLDLNTSNRRNNHFNPLNNTAFPNANNLNPSNMTAGIEGTVQNDLDPSIRRADYNELDYQKAQESNRIFNAVLKSELFGDEVPSSRAIVNGIGTGFNSISTETLKDHSSIYLPPDSEGLVNRLWTQTPSPAPVSPPISQHHPRSYSHSITRNNQWYNNNSLPHSSSSRNLFTYMSPIRKSSRSFSAMTTAPSTPSPSRHSDSIASLLFDENEGYFSNNNNNDNDNDNDKYESSLSNTRVNLSARFRQSSTLSNNDSPRNNNSNSSISNNNFNTNDKISNNASENSNTSQAPSPLRKSRTQIDNTAILDTNHYIYSLSPVRVASQQLLLSPRKQARTISKVPYKVLDAPDLADDFYLNLVDWGSSDILAVGLGSCVYLWTARTGKVTKLCDLSITSLSSSVRNPSDPNNPLRSVEDSITSVSWMQRGTHLAVGTNRGTVQIWDVDRKKKVRTMGGHTSRVGSLAWNTHILTSGSRDRSILHRDVRAPEHFFKRLTAHRQEVCGLKWNTSENLLASGGNDNRLLVWDGLNDSGPLHKFTEHKAAVKAISWNPHQKGILASGGGTADRIIKFWNTSISSSNYSSISAVSSFSSSFSTDGTNSFSGTSGRNQSGSRINQIDTGSQVCNLAWSKNSNELVSTHGYSHNQVVVWKYPSLQQVASLTGHTYRVLYLAMSPDGQTVVTGAGDETLRFWQIFDEPNTDYKKSSMLDALSQIR